MSHLRLVSGADQRYSRSLQQLLLSLERLRLPGRLETLVYDLGLVPERKQAILRRFPWIEMRSYDWSVGPPHLRELMNYGWKPTLITALAEEKSTPLLWLDSSSVVIGDLAPVWKAVAENGVWVPYGGAGPLRDDTHPAISEHLQMTEQENALRFRAAGVCAFDPARPEIMRLLQEWRQMSWQENLLVPPDRSHPHNYDQTLLCLLLDRHGLRLTEDELDISGLYPVPFLRSRNKVGPDVPLWLDPLCRLYFATYRWLDTHWLRWRRAWRATGALPT